MERSHTGCREGVVSHCCEPPVSLNLQAGLAPRMFRELFDEIRHLQVIDSGHDALQLAGLREPLNPESLQPLNAK